LRTTVKALISDTCEKFYRFGVQLAVGAGFLIVRGRVAESSANTAKHVVVMRLRRRAEAADALSGGVLLVVLAGVREACPTGRS